MKNINKIVFQYIVRTLFPDLAQGMLAEGTFNRFKDTFSTEEIAKSFEVEDNGSNTTIFCFAGGAVLYAGLPAFEFRKILKETGCSCNLVFFRDNRRMGYHVAPDGQRNGLAFYEKKVFELIGQLKSSHNVALGSSHGGTAAFYFACRCSMNKVIAFDPVLEWRDHVGARVFLRMGQNTKIFTAPRLYMKNMAVNVGAQVILNKMARELGEDALWDVLKEYRGHPRRPRATVFYGKRYWLDALQAKLIADLLSNYSKQQENIACIEQ
jgi:hypothetical protein